MSTVHGIFTWDGELLFKWPAMGIVLYFILRASSILSPRAAKKP